MGTSDTHRLFRVLPSHLNCVPLTSHTAPISHDARLKGDLGALWPDMGRASVPWVFWEPAARVAISVAYDEPTAHQ